MLTLPYTKIKPGLESSRFKFREICNSVRKLWKLIPNDNDAVGGVFEVTDEIRAHYSICYQYDGAFLNLPSLAPFFMTYT